jgi:uncharacterized protein YkwD
MKSLLLLLFIFPFILLAQDLPYDQMQIDAEILNNQIIKEVNKLRKKAKQDSLVTDSALSNAGKDHADYLAKKQTISHFQKAKNKETPNNRVEFYGGSYSNLGENIQFFNSKTPIKLKGEKQATPITDYERLAKAMVLNWKKSKLHYKNMISPDFTRSWTEISIDPKTGNVYAVQLLGNTPYTTPKEIVDPVKLKPYDSKKCKKANKLKPLDNQNGGVFVDGDSIFFYSDSRWEFRKTIWRWDDGIAADIVLKEDYTCDGENKINGSAGQNGFLLEPIYAPQRGKSNMGLRLFKLKQPVYVYLGQVPDWIDQDFEVNLALINKKRGCIPLVYYNFQIGRITPIDVAYKIDTATPQNYMINTTTQTYNVVFPKNVSTTNDSLIAEIESSLRKIDGKIATARISAFSSVEGSTKYNIELQQARGDVLARLLQPYQKSEGTTFQIKTLENFSELYQDLLNTNWEYLTQLDSVSLKKKINSSPKLLDSISHILANHRYAKCELDIEYKTPIKWTTESVLQQYKNTVNKKDLQSIKVAQSLVMNLLLKDSIDIKTFKELPIPLESKFDEIRSNNLLFLMKMDTFNPNALDQCISEFDTLRLSSPSNKLINTNYAILISNQLNKGQYVSKKGEIDPIKIIKSIPNIDRKVLPLLVINAHLLQIVQFDYNNDYTSLYRELSQLYGYSSKLKLTNEQNYQLAKTFSGYFDFEHSYTYLLKIAKSRNPQPQHLLYMVKILYALNDDIRKKDITKYLERAAEIAGDDFCKYFNSPQLNFQALNDEVFKKTYCHHCSEY